MAFTTDALRVMTPWASTGDRRIPENEGYVRAAGFAAVYSRPLASGGKAPEREVWNQRFYEIDTALAEMMRFGVGEYSAGIRYPIGALATHQEGSALPDGTSYGVSLFRSLKENGPGTSEGIVVPRTDRTVWVSQSHFALEQRTANTFANTFRDVQLAVEVNEYSAITFITPTEPEGSVPGDLWVTNTIPVDSINSGQGNSGENQTQFKAGGDLYRVAKLNDTSVTDYKKKLRIWYTPASATTPNQSEFMRIYTS